MTAAAPPPAGAGPRVRPLRAADVAAVEALVAAAAAEDAVGPLSEAALLRLRAGTQAQPAEEPTRGVSHLVSVSGTTVTGYAQVEVPASGDAVGELLVHPRHRRAGAGAALVRAVAALAGGPVRLWAHGDLPPARALAAAAGMSRVRELWQMARPSSPVGEEPPAGAGAPGTTLRSFRPGVDDETWLALNAAAFATHPEQGRWGPADLQARMREPWFDPAGLLIAEVDGEPAGFHWTKVEPGSAVGEVYVLGVSPRFAGRGLGRLLALAGLQHLARRVREVRLYVDGDNAAAVRLYSSLGFTRTALDVQYRTGDGADGGTRGSGTTGG